MTTRFSACICAALLVLTSSTVPPASARDAEPDERAETLLAQMTLEEKIDLLGGERFFDIDGVPRLGVPAMATADGPFGVRRYARSNVMAGGLALAATWNSELARQAGVQIGRDARARGVHFYLGPGVNIYRAPQNGRNFEYFGEDPLLSSRMAVAYIEGVQSQGVAATVKHFLGNNSEFARHWSDSAIGERALREIYLPAFEAAVRQAHVAAVMDSYNLVNGEHMTQNGRFNLDLLKHEWGFKGVVMSDWDATYDTLAAANGGLDLEMPFGKFLNRAALVPLLQAGKISQQTLDDKVRRLLRVAARFGWLDRPQLDSSIPRYNSQGREVALQTAREGIVLLQNDRSLLPLNIDKVRSIAIIGPDAYPAVPHGGGSATVAPFRAVSFLEGVGEYLGPQHSVFYSRGVRDLRQAALATRFSVQPDGREAGLRAETFDNDSLTAPPSQTRIDRHVDQGAPVDLTAFATGEIAIDFDSLSIGGSSPVSTRWTGYYTPAAAGSHDVFIQMGGFEKTFGYRLYVDDRLVADRWNLKIAATDSTAVTLDASPHKIVLEHRSEKGGFGSGVPFVRLGIVRQGEWTDPQAEQMAARADAVVLAVGFDSTTETEDWDRSFSLPPGQAELIRKITAANPNTVVVITSGGSVAMLDWMESAAAIMQSWYPGQEGGTALAEILFGKVNPSGHLPVTFERRWQDNPVHDTYYPSAGTNVTRYDEGVFVGYRGYEHNAVKPLFAFGHGLSYTTFRYDDLKIRALPGGQGLYDVSFNVTNNGSRAGASIAQLYVSDAKSSVPRPPQELKGFAKISLEPGETRSVAMSLDPRSFAFFDTASNRWRAEAGDFEIRIGSSSDRIELSGMLALPRTLTIPLR